MNNIYNHESEKLNKVYSDFRIKQLLINFIYSKIKLSNFEYQELKTKHDLNILNNTNYLIMPNYIGIMSLLVFMKDNDRYYSFIVEKQSLTVDKQAVLEQIKIWPIKINLNYRIYDGTIFEGICFFKNKTPLLFIFNDMYYFQGIPQFNELLHYKMINMEIYLKKFQSENEQFKIYINEHYTMDKIDDAIKMLSRQKSFNDSDVIKPENLNINGLIFYPLLPIDYTKSQEPIKRLIFNKKQEKSMIYKIINSDTTQQQKQPKQQKQKIHNNTNYEIINSYNEVNLKFLMKKTSISDNYKLFLLTTPINNSLNAEAYKTVFIGYTYISTRDQSIYWYKQFINESSKIVKCKYIVSKKAWTPCELSTDNKPDFMCEFLKYFKQVD